MNLEKLFWMHLKGLDMNSIYKAIGDYIRLIDVRNVDKRIDNLRGMNIYKEFIPSLANVSKSDLSKYKVIKKGQFLYSSMQAGRDETIRVALYQDDLPAIVSPAYFVFEIMEEKSLLPEYLMTWFSREESDRLGWFLSDSSVRASLDWEVFSNIHIPIPNLQVQRKYIAISEVIRIKKRAYEESIRELELICNLTIEGLKGDIKDENTIGHFINVLEQRNTLSKYDCVMGMNVKKEFMPSVANTKNSDLSKYKVINHGQFAYSPMQAGRDETIRVALFKEDNPSIISPAYSVFEVKNENILLPDFLMMWFHRPEFNRLGWFVSDSSVRASLDLKRFLDIPIPIPSISKQQSIVKFFQILEVRKKAYKDINKLTKPICPLMIKGVLKETEK